MFWTNLFCNLAFSFLLGVGVSEQGFDVHPMVTVESDCSCSPCVCQNGCPCPECVSVPCPGTACVCPNGVCPTVYPTACCPTGACPTGCGKTACANAGCPTACCPTACCPTAFCPTVCCPPAGCPTPVLVGQGCNSNAGVNGTVCLVPGSGLVNGIQVIHASPVRAARQYTVDVNLTDGPRVLAPTGTTFLVTPNVPDSMERLGVDEGRRQSSRVTAIIRETGREGVELELGVTGCSGKACQQYHVKKTVPLNTATRVVLSGTGPEPCVAEVVVRPHLPAPIPVALPLPVPPYVPFPQALMPPAPVRVAGMLPEPLPMPAPTVAATEPFALCSFAPAPRGRSSHFSLVREDGASRLKMHGDGVSTTSTRMTVETPEAGKLRVAAGTKRIHVTGQDWKGQADRVEVRPDGHVVLCGHVRLTSEQIGDGATVKADAVTVKLRHGKFERCCREAK